MPRAFLLHHRFSPRVALVTLFLGVLLVQGFRPSSASAWRPNTLLSPPSVVHQSALTPKATEFVGWSELSIGTSQPSARQEAALAGDPLDNSLVLFGGCSRLVSNGTCIGFLADTWLFAGVHWRQLSPTTTPPARAGAAVAWDPLTTSVILFGGEGASGLLNDTWSFSKGAWSKVQPAISPPPELGASMTWDSADSELLLVGGTGSASFPASPAGWTFASGQWHRVSSATAPPLWEFPYLSPNPLAGGVILEGGLADPSSIPSTGQSWLFSGGTWSNGTGPSASTPAGRAWGIGGYDPITFEPILYGGGGTNWTSSDAWELDSRTEWLKLASPVDPPVPFDATQGAMDPSDDVNIEFGSESPGGTIENGSAVSASTWALLTRLNVSVNSLGGASLLVAGMNLSFNVSVTGGIPPYEIYWSFGDGGSAQGPRANFTYPTAGSYEVSVNVSDAAGQSVQFPLGTINVTAPANSTTATGTTSSVLVELFIGLTAVAVVAASAIVWRNRRGGSR